jgi:hypothetical protein
MTFSGTIIIVKMLEDTYFCTHVCYGLMLGRNAFCQRILHVQDSSNVSFAFVISFWTAWKSLASF